MKFILVLCAHIKKNSISVGTVLFVLMFAASCKKENSTSAPYTIPSNLTLISSGYAPGAGTKVEVYATEALYVGYNKLYIALYDSVSGQRITQSQLALSAMTANVQAPAENPAANAVNGLFNGAMVFVSLSSGTLTVQVQNTGGSGTYTFPISLIQPSPARSYSLTTGGTGLFVSIVQPTSPQLGVNTFELVVDRQINATSYAPDSTYMLAINPTMPSMTGMNSPNNVNPTYTGMGHYTGKVDFIMSGGWQVYVNLLQNGIAVDTSHYFSLNL